MAPRIDDVMKLCCELSAHDQIKVAVKCSAKGAMVTGGSAFVGGLLAGPPGLAVDPDGAAPAQKEKLYQDIMGVLSHLDWTDAAQLIALVMGNATLQQQVTAALLNYVTKELKAEVCYKD
ncbi:hypothetical protein WMY93_013206 [Mugilogobius chulae]|uniref:Uncharacterized protein n=1 Tax=Mugilogobius chulae TaxID=88201 RepID=A0AAW0NYU0_9GOBI